MRTCQRKAEQLIGGSLAEEYEIMILLKAKSKEKRKLFPHFQHFNDTTITYWRADFIQLNPQY